MVETLDIELTTQSFESKNTTINLKGTIINYETKKYIISLHHNIPIEMVTVNKKNTTIQINSMWNESLILEAEEHLYSSYHINNIFQKSLPKIEDKLLLRTPQKRYGMKVTGYNFLSFDNSPNSFMIPYITATFIKIPDEKLSGLSGTPIYMNTNKSQLIGLFSKFNSDANIVYILPIYIILKNIDKKNNSHVFGSELQNIKKVGQYNINSMMEIYHPTLKIYVPLRSYFLLEGDDNVKFMITYKTDDMINIIETELTPCQNKCMLSNEFDIIKNNDYYKINTRLLTLLKKSGMDVNIIKLIWSKILSNNKPLWIKINERILSFKYEN
jgi:hypothetical protein